VWPNDQQSSRLHFGDDTDLGLFFLLPGGSTLFYAWLTYFCIEDIFAARHLVVTVAFGDALYSVAKQNSPCKLFL